MNNPVAIVWFRQDLRIEDNPALNKALENYQEIIPLFIEKSPKEKLEWDYGGASKWWLHHSLAALKKELKTLHLDLILKIGDPFEVFTELFKSHPIKAVFWNRRYEPASLSQDAKIKSFLKKEGVDCQSFNASLLYEPWTITNKQGKPFQVFTPFYKHCLSQGMPDEPQKTGRGLSIKTPSVKSSSLDDLKLLPTIPWDQGIKAYWKPGEVEAKKVLKHFIEKDILQYKETRDIASLDVVSHLSPYLHWGEISPRLIWKEVLKQHSFTNNDVESFLRQLVWREFAYHLLYYFPHTPSKPLREEFKKFPWKDHPQELKAWQKGMTGYPYVDAGMRQLWKIGWMHNRLRLVTGSFLVKDLLIGWEEGSKWFWDTLVDADLANNTMGWQWVSGCGADAAPYFRIFNPITQGEKFDPDGDFVKKWVPELSHLPKQWIHKPWLAPAEVLRSAGVELGQDYPFPIVDHAEARTKALEAFAKIKNN